jgi:predicted CXXCH cytochrome family protein
VSHAIQIPHIQPGSSLVIEADRPEAPPLQSTFTMPEYNSLPRIRNDNRPPKLSGIRVAEINRSVLISATIAWKTNEHASSTVRYGINSLNKSYHDGGHFSKNHQITLSGLRADTTYTYVVISYDIFGNQSISSSHTFTTNKFFSAPENLPGEKPAEMIINHKFIKINDDTVILKLSTTIPVAISIGYTQDNRSSKSTLSSPQGEMHLPDDHILLSGKEWSCISICYTCHEEVKGPMSHPVNVRPPTEMVIPPGYPTLPDGRISCMSCHVKHSGNLGYRLLKSSNRELCVGCHQDI